MSKEIRGLILFLAATFAVTYCAYFTIVLAGWSPYQFPGLPLFLLGGSAPTWVALLLVFSRYDKDQRRAFFSRLNPRLIPGRIWAFIVLVFPLVFAVVYLVSIVFDGPLPGMTGLKDYLASPWLLPLGVLIGLFSGPIVEEFGWRGFALDPLMRRFGRVTGSAVLGFLWGIWHLGLFFMPQTWHGQLGFRPAGFMTFVLASVGLALVMTWVHVGTKGSILAAILMHFFNNFTGNVLAPHADEIEILRMVVLLAAGFSLCLWIARGRRLSTAPAEGQPA